MNGPMKILRQRSKGLPMDDLRIALACMESVFGGEKENLKKIRDLALRAWEGKADILLLPEMCLTGYALSPSDIKNHQRTANHVARQIQPMAKAFSLLILPGFIEDNPRGKPWIAQAAIGPQGLVGVHRKTHLSPQETESYAPGEDIRILEWKNLRFGIQICYEAHFPEISTTLALMGADILFFPHASPRGTPDEKCQSWSRHLPARAFDNGVYVAACNPVGFMHSGASFPGVALVLGPDGRDIASLSGTEESLLFADLKADFLARVRSHRMRYFLPGRRPGLYQLHTDAP